MARAILVHRDFAGLWYGDLYFPYMGSTLQSPITGKLISNEHHLPLVDLIAAHITKLQNHDIEIKSLPLWLTYVEARSMVSKKGIVSYETFMRHYLKAWANNGYSETLLTCPAIV